METSTREQAAQRIERRLARLGYRVTQPRRRLIEKMLAFETYFSSDALAVGEPSVGRATVFRSLHVFLRTGALCQVVLEDGSIVYRVAEDGTHHHHLVCVDCDLVEEFSSELLEAALAHAGAAHGYQVTGHRLEIYGRCDHCPTEASSGGRAHTRG
jgi:Fur family transcriptional regulator, ferric uptake regulator